MELNFEKNNGLIPAIIQDATTKIVLMLGYMNQEAIDKTTETGKVTFYSRSKKRLWTKGEESGHFLNLVTMDVDCDNDTLLIMVEPIGPTCHKGSDTCWNKKNKTTYGFLSRLEETIKNRKENPSEESYTSSLFDEGINKIAQKVGEEAVEFIIEALGNNKDKSLNEGADLIYHFLVLLQQKGYVLDDVVEVLKERHK